MDWSSDLLFTLRSDRAGDDRILLVYVGTQDLEALGGWPLTRDYTSYFLHIMQEKNAAVVAIDFLFSDPDRRYSEYDDILSHTMRSNGVVVLPLVFNRFQKDRHRIAAAYTADHPVRPYAPFLQAAKGLGFGNLIESSVVHQLPLTALYKDTLFLSLGTEIARVYWGGRPVKLEPKRLVFVDQQHQQHGVPLNPNGELRLNHANLHFNSISLVQLLQTYQHTPDSLQVQGKIVLLAVTAAGHAHLKTTPAGVTLSSSLLHAIVAENILNASYLRSWPAWATLGLILAMVGIPISLATVKPRRKWLWIFLLPCLCLMLSLLTLIAINRIVGIIFPSLAWAIATTWAGWCTHHEQQNRIQEQQRLWQEQIEKKSERLQELVDQVDLAGKEKQQLSEAGARLLEEKTAAVRMLEKHLRDLQPAESPVQASSSFDIVHAPSGKLADILALVDTLSRNDMSVLIMGETGTGKELIARAIHQASPRHKAPFLAVNCGALSETLLESELFGHEKGSFTGATARRRGVFELADNGTLFLDEISETTPALQTKLLRVLQEQTLYRLGGEQAIRVNVRVIASGNRDIKELVQRSLFRADLYYRLNGFTLYVPPLRERLEDIPLLTSHFLQKHGYKNITDFSEEVLSRFKEYPWPGNVRELENVVRRAGLLADRDQRKLVQVSDLPKEIAGTESAAMTTFQPIEDQILELLRTFQFSRDAISQTARALGKKDRGTITEYFRGLVFEHLAASEYDLETAAKGLAGTEDQVMRRAIHKKMIDYLTNLDKWHGDDEEIEKGTATPFHGLPKKYHPALRQVWRAVKEKRIR